MKPFIVKNFKFGLDKRRDSLTSQPGTLETLTNGHINNGGEVEKRKAFVRTALTADCFDIVSTEDGLIAIGSNADPGGWPRGAVTGYQRLQHPAVSVIGVSYNAGRHAMTGVLFSTTFDGNAFVVATFADGFTFLFYDGQAISASWQGIMFTGMTNLTLADTFARDWNTLSGWSAFVGSYVPAVVNGFADVQSGAGGSPVGVSYTLLKTLSSASSELSFLSATPASEVAGTPAQAQFTVNGMAGYQYRVTAPAEAGYTSLYIEVADYIVDWTTSNNDTAAAIASSINSRTAVHGFSATSLGAVVTVKAPLPDAVPARSASASYTWNPLVVISVSDVTAAGSKAFSSGTATKLAEEQASTWAFGGTWAQGNTWSVSVVTDSVTYTLGRGALGAGWSSSSLVPTALITDRNRVYLGNSSIFNLSAVGDPTLWEQQDIGASFISYNSQYGDADTVKGFGLYQGKLAVLGRRSIQIWDTNADPAQFALSQTLSNTGTLATRSVASLGELDVLYLSDSGIRSLRVLNSSLNAFSDDIGSPIDSLIREDLVEADEDDAAAACAIVEPTATRYWLFLNGKIYVLSYFRSSKITAWSVYLPTYQSGADQVVFTPTKFILHEKQVFAWDGTAIYAYGGSDGDTYDNAVVTLETPWFDDNQPSKEKVLESVDVGMTGRWTISVGTDPYSGTLSEVLADGTAATPLSTKDSSFDKQTIGCIMRGTHFKIKAVSSVSNVGLIKLSCFVVNYSHGQDD